MMVKFHLYVDESGNKNDSKDPFVIAGPVISLKPGKITRALKKTLPFIPWPLHGNLLNRRGYVMDHARHYLNSSSEPQRAYALRTLGLSEASLQNTNIHDVRTRIWSSLERTCEALFSRRTTDFMVAAAEDLPGSAIDQSPYSDRYICLFRVFMERVIDLLLTRESDTELYITVAGLPLRYDGHRYPSGPLVLELIQSLTVHEAIQSSHNRGIVFERASSRVLVLGGERHPCVRDFSRDQNVSGGLVLADLIANRTYNLLRAKRFLRANQQLDELQHGLYEQFFLQTFTSEGARSLSHFAAGPQQALDLRVRRAGGDVPVFDPNRRRWAVQQANTWC